MAKNDVEVYRQGVIQIVTGKPDIVDRLISGAASSGSAEQGRRAPVVVLFDEFITPSVLRGEK
jgi:hypothetical protein